MQKTFDIGIMFRCLNSPESLIPFVQRAETAGFDEVWIVEDCFFAGGIASTAVTLAKTEHIRVGLGIMPAVARNPAFAAMEIAALARLFPGRLLPGFGHGVGDWMRQIGAFPASQLAALGEVTETVRALLAGKMVDFQGQHVHLSDVQLEFPLETPPPVSLGVRGPKSLQLSGRVSDGTILAEHASAPYVAWALEQIRIGQAEGGRENEPHRVTVYTYCALDADHQTALDKLRPRLARAIASGSLSAYLEPLGIQDEASRLVADKGTTWLEKHLPDAWITQLAVAGTPAECRDGVRKLAAAGANSVVLVPVEDDFQTLTTLSDTLLPLLAE